MASFSRLSIAQDGSVDSLDAEATVVSVPEETIVERMATDGSQTCERNEQAEAHEGSSEERKDSTEERPSRAEKRSGVEKRLNETFRTDRSVMEMEREFGLFVSRRYYIWRRRMDGMPRETWTIDPILNHYRFCNVFRVLDRTSQWVVEQLDSPEMSAFSPMDTLLFCWLFRRTNGYEGWRYLLDETGAYPTMGNVIRGRYFSAMEEADRRHALATSVPYNVANGCHKGVSVLRELRSDTLSAFDPKNDENGLIRHLSEDDDFTWENMIEALCTQRRIGPFLAQQIVTDFGYSQYGSVSWEMSGVLPGPGSRRGLQWIYPDERWTNDHACSDRIYDLQSRIDEIAGDMIRLTYGGMSRSLSVMDVQNCLCEFDKYQRLKNGTGFYRRVFSKTRPPHELVIPNCWRRGGR